MVNSCCAFGCTNRFIKKSGIGFFRFPADPVRRKLWILALRRKNFEPTRTSVVCGEHFQTGKPSKNPKHPDYMPNIFIFKPSRKTHCGLVRKKSCDTITENLAKEYSVPEVIMNTEVICASLSFKTKELSETKDGLIKQEREMLPECVEVKSLTEDKVELQMDFSAEEVSDREDEVSNLMLELQQVSSTLRTVTKEKDVLVKELSSAHVTQSILCHSISEKEEELLKLKRELQQAYVEVDALRREKEELQKKLCAADVSQSILQSHSKLHYYTGLNSLKDFHLILSLLSSLENNIKNVSLESQVLMVLMKLKLNLWNIDLAHRFQTSATTVHRICATIIPFLETKLDMLVKNPVNNALKRNIPGCFKNTVYENLYQRLQRNSKSKKKQFEEKEIDLGLI